MKASNYNYVPLEGYENFEATTQIIIRELLKRNIDFEVLDADNNLIIAKHNGKEYPILEGTISDANSLIAFWISNDKWMTRQFIQRKGLSLAPGILLREADNAPELDTLKFPLVVKPADTDHGIAVSTNINNKTDLDAAIAKAFEHSKRVIVEEFFPGREYRFLVIDGKLRAIAYREPANVVGDGSSTVAELIEKKNIGRGDDYTHPLLKIKVDQEVQRHLKAQNIGLESLLPKDQKIYLRNNSNLSTGGDSIDMTDDMPQYYIDVAQEAAAAANLKIAGIDMIIKDIKAKPSSNNYILVELNAPAMLSMHDYPYIGRNRQVECHILNAIFKAK